MRRKGALLLLFFFLLLLPPSQPSNGQVVSGAILLSRTLVWGTRIIRVSLPFTLARLKRIYQAWKSAGRPSFNYLGLALQSALLYISASLLSEKFQEIYALSNKEDIGKIL